MGLNVKLGEYVGNIETWRTRFYDGPFFVVISFDEDVAAVFCTDVVKVFLVWIGVQECLFEIEGHTDPFGVPDAGRSNGLTIDVDDAR